MENYLMGCSRCNHEWEEGWNCPICGRIATHMTSKKIMTLDEAKQKMEDMAKV